MKLALFTDTLEDINGVARFVRDMGEQAAGTNCELVIHTCMPTTQIKDPPFARRDRVVDEVEDDLPPLADEQAGTEEHNPHIADRTQFQ